MSRLIACLALAVAVWLAPAVASARATLVTLDLRASTGDVPTHLCVVSEARGPRTTRQLWDLLEKAPVPDPDPAGPRRWRLLPAAWNGPASQPAPSCSSNPVADCRPEVELPRSMTRDSDLFVACTADTLSAGSDAPRDPRVLVILLEQLEASPPDVESLRLAGGIATVGVLTSSERATFTARSLGGHYMPHARSFRETSRGAAGRSISPFQISPRCRWTEVALPRTDLRPQDLARMSVSVHGAPLDIGRCVRDVYGQAMRILVPRAPLDVGTLDVDLAPTEDAAAASFGARWKGPWPPAPFDLEFRQLTFVWRPPACVYPADRCPRATLDNGIVCASTPSEHGCSYTCPGERSLESDVDLPLPMGVEFERADPVQRWPDRLAANGQTLSSYVPPDQTFLDVDLSSWHTEMPGNQIRKIRIFRPDGVITTFNVTQSRKLQVNMPNASCAEVPFEIEGDRPYREGRAPVVDGRLDMNHAYKRARIISFNLMALAGGGPAWSPLLAGSTSGPPVFFGGLLQFALRARPRNPKAARLAFEGRIAINLGQWGAVVFEDEMGSVQESFQDFIWTRFMGGVGMVANLSARVALGVGLDVGTSFPARTQRELPGIAFTFITSPNLDLRLRLRRYLSLVLQVRGVVDKAFQSRASSGDTGGATPPPPDTSRKTAGTLMTLVGAMVHF